MSARRLDRVNQKKEKRNFRIVSFAVPAYPKVKLKESKKGDKYQELARELKRQLNMKVMIISIVIVMLDTIIKGFVQRLKNLEKEDEWRPFQQQH